ncbi:MAG: NAD-dependent deacylase [Alphaproteobacteria bacterium]|nr:NAD-dependent deacylase [Alphaproteobacteria bacterium]
MRRDGRIVILTGAGISKESGLDTFRDEGGLWSKVRIEDVATYEAYQRDPERVLEFYNERWRGMASGNIRPNAAHDALARLERDWPDEVVLVTQNIDNLHGKAGSKSLIHMHGEMAKARCDRCQHISPFAEDLTLSLSCPSCKKIGAMRPHVVWFGEMPLEMERIYAALGTCDLFVSIGTSGNVYPAAGFVQEASAMAGAHTLELNLEPSDGASAFAEARYGPATVLVPAFVDQMLSEGWEAAGA